MNIELPLAFSERLRALLGASEYEAFEQALSQDASVSIRINPAKCLDVHQLKTLSPALVVEKPVSWCKNGYYLQSRPIFTFDPLFHAGLYYVQEASSMFVAQVINQYVNHTVTALDLCAAPGGKSTLLRSCLPADSLLVANEVIRSRSQILAENCTKWGHPNLVVTNADPREFEPLKQLFDVILVDAPCSGEGMFRKDTTAIEEWSEENVEICQGRQRRILSDIWGCLKPGGLLIYSTCTYNTLENEENVSWLMQEFDAQPLPIDIQSEWNITNSLLKGFNEPVYRFLPHKTHGEGLFMAVVRKPESDDPLNKPKANKRNKKGKPSQPLIKTAQLEVLKKQINADHITLRAQETKVTAIPSQYSEIIELLEQQLHVLQAGICMAELKGKDLIPCHALAMSNILQKGAFAQVEVDEAQALSYLRRDALVLPADTPRGYVLVCYKGFPLGFAKQVGNRANNLYPQEWRIRKQL